MNDLQSESGDQMMRMSSAVDTNTVSLLDYQEILHQVCPGAHMTKNVYGRLTVGVGVSIHNEYDRAANGDHAVELVNALGERLRIVAMRELGIDKIVNAYQREIAEFKRTNQELQHLADSRGSLITDLREELDELKEALVELSPEEK